MFIINIIRALMSQVHDCVHVYTREGGREGGREEGREGGREGRREGGRDERQANIVTVLVAC